MGQGAAWDKWSIAEIKEKMAAYFGEESRMHARKLEGFKQGNLSLSAYCDKFKKLAAACGSTLTEVTIKDLFLRNLRNEELA